MNTPILLDFLPAKARKYVYAGVVLVGLVWGSFQAANGDWKVVMTALIGTLTAALAHGNVNPDEQDGDDPDAT